MKDPVQIAAPDLEEIQSTYATIRDDIHRTPVWAWDEVRPPVSLPEASHVWLKLELFQRSGTFKIRAALATAKNASAEVRARGFTAVSAGNHAIAVALAAKHVGSHAKVVMLEHSSIARIRACQALGAEILLAPNVHRAFEWVHAIQHDEGRYFIHPFEGPDVARGTGTLSLELLEQLPEVDAIVCPIGGGGLIAGLASAAKQLRPSVRIYGVEPFGADSMYRSFAAGGPVELERVQTIADSLGAPHAAPYSYALCRRYVDDVVRVSDDELRLAMRHLLENAHLAVEPAAAASTAAILGPLRSKLRGARIAAIVCGSNIDADRYRELLAPVSGDSSAH